MKDTLKQSISRYLDAGFPILYINTFEEEKTEKIICRAADRRTILHWSMAQGYGEYEAKTGEWLVPPGTQLFATSAPEGVTADARSILAQVIKQKLLSPKELARTVLLIKDAHILLEDGAFVASLKELAVRISGGLDCCVILMTPKMSIPVELEKFITILDSDYLSFESICQIIGDFVKDNELPPLSTRLLEEMAVAFKGLTEFEINNILALAVAEDGNLSRRDLQLIFELKRQMILKSGILEMVPGNESIEDIGGLENLKQWLRRKARIIQNIKRAEGLRRGHAQGCADCRCSRLREISLCQGSCKALRGAPAATGHWQAYGEVFGRKRSEPPQSNSTGRGHFSLCSLGGRVGKGLWRCWQR